MRESDIDKRFAKQDEDVVSFINKKFRGMKKPLAAFSWAGKHPLKAVLILFIFIGLSFFVYFGAVVLITGVDVKETIETKTGIKFK